MEDAVIKVENLTKEYKIGKRKETSFRDSVTKLFSRREKVDERIFRALDGVNFEIFKGEAVGIIGRNGAGKSTLLKVLSRITEPTRGRISITGRVASLLEVGTGFHPELTGRENIFLNGTILGMSREEVRQKFDEILDFSGVEKFIDTPVKHYSSGMYVRLAFSVAAHLEPEILIVDEVLAVGDADFQKKCLGKMGDVAGEGRTVLFVSHNMGAIKSLCSSSILLERGKVIGQDHPDKIISYYLNKASTGATNHYVNQGDKEMDGCIQEIRIIDGKGMSVSDFAMDDEIFAELHVKIEEPSDYTLSAQIKEMTHVPIIHSATTDTGFKLEQTPGLQKIKMSIKPLFLYPNQYILRFVLFNVATGEYDEVDNLCFNISQNSSIVSRPLTRVSGLIYQDVQWEKI